MNGQEVNEEIIRERRKQRVREMQRRKRKQQLFRKYLKLFVPAAAGAAVLLILIIAGINSYHKSHNKESVKEEKIEIAENGQDLEDDDESVIDQAFNWQSQNKEEEDVDLNGQEVNSSYDMEEEDVIYAAQSTADTVQVGEDVVSTHAIFIDLSSNSILARRDDLTIINPASMTKILTVLVAAEHISEEDMDDTFTITIDITDYSYSNDCSSVGFAEGETVSVRDLFYGTILPSGADAAVGLATYVAGSHEAFVELMNEKLKELGLSNTAHVTNCVGLYDEEHYCTVYDMAMILEAAIDNELCREVLSAHTYTTSQTAEHPEGITISNWFLRRIEDKDTGGEVICGKTGYVVQSGNCAASYGVDSRGNEYICVTVNATSAWRCIYDHVALYKQFAAE